jgi:hypothetical protein
VSPTSILASIPLFEILPPQATVIVNAAIGSTKMFAPANLQILSPATIDLAP